MATFIPESLVMDYGSTSSIELNQPGVNGAFRLEDIDPGMPARRPTWIQGDTDGSVLPSDPPYDDAQGTATIRWQQSDQTAMDAALAALSALTQKMAECSAAGPQGLPVLWTAAGATNGYTMYWKLAEYDGAPPMTTSGDLVGWWQANPVVKIRFTRSPAVEGSEVILPSVSSTNPLLTTTVTGVPGDMPAKARLILTDGASQARRFIEWGLEQRQYQSATSLQLNAASSMTLLGGTSTTRTGSVNTNVVRGTLTTSPSAIASTGSLSHIGTFRVHGRVYASSASVYVRLAYADGSGVFRANTYALPPVNGGWADVDLGTITITKAISGTQQWSGRIEAIGAAGDTLDVDFLHFIPAGEGYGRARGAYSYTAGAITGRDDFESATAGSSLSGRTLPAGGTWSTVTGSVATDFTAAMPSVFTPLTTMCMTRATAGESFPGRIAVFGSAIADTDIQCTVSVGGTWNGMMDGPVARVVDANNFIFASPNPGFIGTFGVLVYIAGSPTAYRVPFAPGSSSPAAYTVRLVVYSSGRIIASISNLTGTLLSQVDVTHSAAATGGTLETGNAGIRDWNNSGNAFTRFFDNVVLSTPAPEPIALYSGRKAEVRWDAAIRQDSGGTTYGPIPSYRGAHFWIPPAGDKGLTSRIAVRANRNDLEASSYDNAGGDSLTAQVAYTPRFLLPR